MNTIITIDSIIEESSFLSNLYEITKEDYNIQQSIIQLEHIYNKTMDQDILLEGVSDIVDNIVKFFKNLLAKFKDFFKNIIMYMNSHLMELDKFVKKYKDELNKIDVKFTIDGYKYTIPDKSCPNLDSYHKLVGDYNNAIADMKSLKGDELDKERNETLSDANQDRLRASILGYSKPIPEDEFAKTIREFFRDGQEDTIELEITKSTLGAIIKESESLSKTKAEALKMQIEIESLLNKTILFFDKKISTVYKGDGKVMYGKTINTDENKFSTSEISAQSHSDATETNVNKLLKLKYDQSKQIATMTTLVATERTKALNDNIALFRKILKEALFKPKEDNTKKEDN